MRNNPYEEAAALEKKIVRAKASIARQERRFLIVGNKIKSTDTESSKLPRLLQQFRDREICLARSKRQLKGMIASKRQLESKGRRLLYGDVKTVIKRKTLHREVAQELRNQNLAISSLKGITRTFRNGEEQLEKTRFHLFISHASEDKEDFVRPLAEALIARDLSVWYDEFSLSIGDSLRKSIDHGLSNSSFGLVILSSSFFAKNWTQYELNGLVSREMEGHKVILPIWHKVSKDDVMRFSPFLVDKVALNSSLLSVDEIAEKITDAVKRS